MFIRNNNNNIKRMRPVSVELSFFRICRARTGIIIISSLPRFQIRIKQHFFQKWSYVGRVK